MVESEREREERKGWECVVRVRVFAMRAAAYELDDCAGETDPFGRSLSDPEPPPPLASPPESEPLSESREFVSAEAVARSEPSP